MKLVLLFAFLALSFALPVLALFRNRSDKKIVLLFFGMLVYVLTTVLVSFFAQAWHITQYVSVSERLQYILLLSVILSLVLFGFSKAAKKLFVKGNGESIYAGYSFINVFIYNMSSYGILSLVGFFRSSGRLEQMYGKDYAVQLTAYYDSISVVNILALIVELVLTFYILYRLFVNYINSEKRITDLVIFFVLVCCMYLIQFLSPNMIIAFVLYAAEAVLVSGKLRLIGKKS